MKIKGVNLENRRFIQGAMILNVPAGCVNLGEDGIKRIYTKVNGKSVRVSYLSGQFVKAKIKDTLEERGEVLSLPELVQESGKKNTPTTSCNPFKYLDDDLFGYMNVIPANKDDAIDPKNKGTTRVGSFKISYFLGKEGDTTEDYGIKRNGALDGDKLTTMPLRGDTRLFASTQYSGCFSVDLNCTGRFFKKNISGFRNISDRFPIDEYADLILSRDDEETILKPEIRTERIKKLIEVFPYISGGARMSTLYADISPKFVVYCITNSGSNPFQEITNPSESLNIKSLKEGITDFIDVFKSNIYIAKRQGFLDDKNSELLKFVKDFNEANTSVKIIYNDDLSGVNSITKRFSDEVLSNLYFEVKGI